MSTAHHHWHQITETHQRPISVFDSMSHLVRTTRQKVIEDGSIPPQDRAAKGKRKHESVGNIPQWQRRLLEKVKKDTDNPITDEEHAVSEDSERNGTSTLFDQEARAEWRCSLCLYENPMEESICDVCATGKPGEDVAKRPKKALQHSKKKDQPTLTVTS